ncbi:MAG: HAD-IIIA family hydrolase, partial [Bacteroidota bacterium]
MDKRFREMNPPSLPTTAIVLAGGLGTRLRSVVQDLPKPMAPVAGQPFLSYVLDYLAQQGIRKVILSIGYKGTIIQDYYGDRFREMQLQYAVETVPLGTGGAIQLALQQCSETSCYVVNGDTLFEADLSAMAAAHNDASADLSMALKQMQDFDRYGLVELDEAGQVQAFREKQYCAAGLINAGVYLINRSIFEVAEFPGKFSFEKDLLEAQLSNLKFIGCPLEGYFIDIGIPTDFAKAQKDFQQRAAGFPASLAKFCNTLFLDRDGVINRRIPDAYVNSWDDFEFLPGVLQAIAQFSESFQRIVVVTNQQGVGKGYMSSDDVEQIHNSMLA